MNSYARIAAEAADQYLAVLGRTQETFLNAMATSMAWTPPVPSTPPVADFPTPQEMVGVSFAFAQKLLNQQQDFAHKLLVATETRPDSAGPKISGPPPKNKSASGTHN